MKMRNALWPLIVASLFVSSPLLAKVKLITDSAENIKQTNQKTFPSRAAPTQPHTAPAQSHTAPDGGNH